MESRLITRTGLIARTVLAFSIAATLAGAPADARRGGSFGSRGSHTYYSPSATRLSPGYTAPVSRSMTDRPTYGSSQYAPSYAPRSAPLSRPGLFHGFGGGLLTGLVAGGLIGHFFGHGYGGGWGGSAGGGLLATLFQIALIGGGIWLVMRLFRGRSQAPDAMQTAYQPSAFASAPAYAPSSQGDDIALSPSDQEAFERLLLQLQDAFSKEDYGRLREITTPEIMSYLAEELSDNATHGRRNDVSATRLLDGEVSEAWSEDNRDYATIAMRYESVDVMRDRTTGTILAGSALTPTETTEIWTFVRPTGSYGAWKVSAIQDA
jgi:predicted lipid-binding transport protein (Tim44 family)